MNRLSQKQVFKGGWEELESAVFTDNKLSLAVGVKSSFMKPDGKKLILLTIFNTVEVFPLKIAHDPNSIGIKEDTYTITVGLGHDHISFKDDGRKMYILDILGKKLYEFVVPIPYVPSSIVNPSVFLNLSVVGNPTGFVLSTDGDYLFVPTGTSVFSFPLPTFWSITSNTSNTFFTLIGDKPHSIAFKREGNKMYIGRIDINIITEYNLTLWIVNGAIPSGNVFLIPDSVRPDSIFFRSNGKEFFVFDPIAEDVLVKYHLDIEWIMSSAFYHSNRFSPIGDRQFAISWMLPDRMKFFVLGRESGNSSIREYFAKSPGNITDATPGEVFPINTIDTNVQAWYWNDDNKTCYILGIVSNAIHQLDLSTGGDVSTMSDPGISFPLTPDGFSTGSGLYITKDKDKFFVMSQSGTKEMFEYNMVIVGDITSGVLLNIRVFTETNFPFTPFFRDDGLTLLVLDASASKMNVLRFTLSARFSSATITYTNEFFHVGLQAIAPRGIYVSKHNGKELYVVDDNTKDIFSYQMSLDFNNAIITEFGDELATELGETLVYQ